MGGKSVDAELVLRTDLSSRGITNLDDLPASEIVELVCQYALWLPVDTYRRAPWLAPFAVRRLRNRTDDRAPGTKRDLWGFPDEDGYFADDNSLIKGVVKDLGVNPPESPYRTDKIGKGLICCHVWPATTTNSLLFSFVPNLVWLPRSLAGYSDAHLEGPPHIAHEVLKATATRRYRTCSPELGRARSLEAWDCLLDTDADASSRDIEFEAGDRIVSLVHRRVQNMIDFLEATLADERPPPRRFSKRYHAGAGPGIDQTVWPAQDAVSAEARRRLVVELRACMAPS